MFSISIAELIKLPAIRTIVTVLTIAVCVCPGIVMTFLYDQPQFQKMEIIKLILLAISINILCYLGLYMFIFVLTIIETLFKSNRPSTIDEHNILLKELVEKSFVTTTVMILFGIFGTLISNVLTGRNFIYDEVLKDFKWITGGFIIGWFVSFNAANRKDESGDQDESPNRTQR